MRKTTMALVLLSVCGCGASADLYVPKDDGVQDTYTTDLVGVVGAPADESNPEQGFAPEPYEAELVEPEWTECMPSPASCADLCSLRGGSCYDDCDPVPNVNKGWEECGGLAPHRVGNCDERIGANVTVRCCCGA